MHIINCEFLTSVGVDTNSSASNSSKKHFFVGAGNDLRFSVQRNAAADNAWQVADSSSSQLASAFDPPTPLQAASVASAAGATTPHAYMAAAMPLVYAPKRTVRNSATSFMYVPGVVAAATPAAPPEASVAECFRRGLRRVAAPMHRRGANNTCVTTSVNASVEMPAPSEEKNSSSVNEPGTEKGSSLDDAEGGGDGIVDDDHGRIQAAIDVVKDGGGGIVRLAGQHVYTIRSPLIVPPNVELRGANDGQ